MSNVPFAAQMEELAAYMASKISVPTIGIGGGYAPIGTINFFDATTAPQDWLACDGSVHNIADYPQLAEWYATQHGAANFYGGNGTTTFAVPNLQGEFLRGAGTNGHANSGDGSHVGEHQSSTLFPIVSVSKDGEIYTSQFNNVDGSSVGNIDKKITIGTLSGRGRTSNMGTAWSRTDTGNAVTIRPTNTSFLICVKAVVAGEVYSTEEREVGTWVDGKKLYRRVLTSNSALVNNQEIALGNVDTVIVKDFVAYNATGLFTPMAQGLYASSTFDSSYYYDPLKHSLVLQLGEEFVTSRGTGGYRLIVEYTKTT